MSKTLQKKLSTNWTKVKKTLCTKLKIEDIVINTNSGILLVDYKITDNFDENVKYSAKNIKILNSLS